MSKFRKIHIPGHADYEPSRPFQHAERHYFEPGPHGFGAWQAFGGVVGMAICNDRRWPETYRVLGLQGAELILIGYNTPLYYSPDPTQNALSGFHNHLVMQAGAYQNGAYVVGVAKGGFEEGVESLSQSVIIAPSGQIIAQSITLEDELITATIDLDFCETYKGTLFQLRLLPDARALRPGNRAARRGGAPGQRLMGPRLRGSIDRARAPGLHNCRAARLIQPVARERENRSAHAASPTGLPTPATTDPGPAAPAGGRYGALIESREPPVPPTETRVANPCGGFTRPAQSG